MDSKQQDSSVMSWPGSAKIGRVRSGRFSSSWIVTRKPQRDIRLGPVRHGRRLRLVCLDVVGRVLVEDLGLSHRCGEEKTNTMLTMICVPRTVAWPWQIDGSLTVLFLWSLVMDRRQVDPAVDGWGKAAARWWSPRWRCSAVKIEHATREDPEWSLRAWRRDSGRALGAICVEGLGDLGGGRPGSTTISDMTRLDRITTDPEICHGKPTVRGLRYPVENLLELLASGMTIEEVIHDHPDLERDDLLAALEFGALTSGNRVAPFSAA